MNLIVRDFDLGNHRREDPPLRVAIHRVPLVKDCEQLGELLGRDVDRVRSLAEEHLLEELTFAFERMDAPRVLVTRITDAGLPFGGTWTSEIAPVPGGSRLRITEDGEIYNPLFRFMARFIFGYDGTIKLYLSALETKVHGI